MKAIDIVTDEIDKLWLERDTKVDHYLRGGGNDPRDIEAKYDFAIMKLRLVAIKLENK